LVKTPSIGLSSKFKPLFLISLLCSFTSAACFYTTSYTLSSEDDLVGSTSALEKVAKLIPEQCLNLVCVLTLFPPKPTKEMAFSLSPQFTQRRTPAILKKIN
jgi:hypothetical protein